MRKKVKGKVMKKKIRKGARIVMQYKKIIAVLSILILAFAIYYFWHDIFNAIVFTIQGFKKNWKTILLGFVSYKFILVNISKRYAINKGVDRFKKTLIYSELDELLSIAFSIFSNEIGVKVEKAKRIRYIGWFIGIIVNIFSWVFIIIGITYASIKFGLFSLLITKVLSAQFWTMILSWITNIPGFFTILGVWFWLWLEVKIPWIPRFYFWLSIKIRIILDPIWESIEPIFKYIWDMLLRAELAILTPIGNKMDDIEIKLIRTLKYYIYSRSSKKAFGRYMNFVKVHNNKQLEKKKEKEQVRKLRIQSMIEKKTAALEKIKEKKEKKQKQNDEN